MLMKPYFLMFNLFLIVGTMMACSAESWFTCWIGLEINLMSLIPLLLIKMNPLSTESAIKYFLTQAMASIIIMFSSLSDNLMFLNYELNHSSNLIFIALLIKSGMAPFHLWFPQVMGSSEWFQCFIILSWQKIAPFVLISSLFIIYSYFLAALLSALVGGLGGLNQTNIKIILTYSSIIHSSWMLSLIFLSFNSWINYFLIYTFISLSLISCFFNSSILFTPQINFSKWGNLLKINFSISLLSLGGLPPFMGFAAKIIALNMMIMNLNFIFLMILIMCSLISLFYYTQLIYNLIMTSSEEMKNLKTYSNKFMHLIFSISILGNCMTPIFISLT